MARQSGVGENVANYPHSIPPQLSSTLALSRPLVPSLKLGLFLEAMNLVIVKTSVRWKRDLGAFWRRRQN